MTARAASPIPFVIRRDSDEAVEWSDDYCRVTPGTYFGCCYWAKKYRDPGFRRWTCLLLWNVLTDDLQRTTAKRIPMWLNLGENDKPRASRRGKYLAEWAKAAGVAPTKGDRLSTSVFTKRIARIEIADTKSPAPYSVVRKIVRWETGIAGHSVIEYTSQVGKR